MASGGWAATCASETFVRWMDIPGESKGFRCFWMKRLPCMDDAESRQRTAGKRLADGMDQPYRSTGQKAVTFYRDPLGELMTGMPENIPTPYGLERIVCGSACEAERIFGDAAAAGWIRASPSTGRARSHRSKLPSRDSSFRNANEDGEREEQHQPGVHK